MSAVRGRPAGSAQRIATVGTWSWVVRAFRALAGYASLRTGTVILRRDRGWLEP